MDRDQGTFANPDFKQVLSELNSFQVTNEGLRSIKNKIKNTTTDGVDVRWEVVESNALYALVCVIWFLFVIKMISKFSFLLLIF